MSSQTAVVPNRTLDSSFPYHLSGFIIISLLAAALLAAGVFPSFTTSFAGGGSAAPPSTPICGAVVYVSGNIAADTTWTTDNLYVLNSDISVLAGVTLTITPGVVIKGRDNTQLLVHGRLVAEGTQANPVYFTSWKDDAICGDTNGDNTASSPVAGDWGWIDFREGSDEDSSVQRAVVKYGGNDFGGWAGSIVLRNVSPRLEYISFENNFRNAVEIAAMNWTTNSWNSSTVVYWMAGDRSILAANTITVTLGAKIKLGDNAQIFVNGKLIANGTMDDPIIFTSERDDDVCGIGAAGEAYCDTNNDGTATVPAAGDWGWIDFREGSDEDSSVQRAVMKYGGNDFGGWAGSIVLRNVSPTLDNITLEGNYRNGVEIAAMNWTSHTLDSTTVIYWLPGDRSILAGNTLTIEPGVKMKFGDDAQIFVDGNLTANGIITNPIVFTSVKDDEICGVGAYDEDYCDTNNDGIASVPAAGDWGWIDFRPGSDEGSSLQRAVIKYGGNDFGGWGGSVILRNVSPTLDYITFEDNFRNGVEVAAVNWTDHTLDSTTVVYWLPGDRTVLPGNTLTIVPGTKWKFGDNAKLFIDGKLIADGTDASPITFTTERDDTLCGRGASGEPVCDTNNDQNSTVPVSGDWGWIEFGPTSDSSSTIQWAVFRFGGNSFGGWAAALRLNDVAPMIAHVLFVNNHSGLDVYNGARPTLVCNDFVGNESHGLYNGAPETIVLAENQWWGHASGPQGSSNPGGLGDAVSDGVDFTPWASSACTSESPAHDFAAYLPLIISD